MKDEHPEKRDPESHTSDISFGGWLGDAVGLTISVRGVARRHMRCITIGLSLIFGAIAIAILAVAFYLVSTAIG